MTMKNEHIKAPISIIAFLAAIVIGFIALFIPPQGVLDSSVLWFTAQLLVFVSGLLGIDLSIDSIKHTAHTRKTKKSDDSEDQK